MTSCWTTYNTPDGTEERLKKHGQTIFVGDVVEEDSLLWVVMGIHVSPESGDIRVGLWPLEPPSAESWPDATWVSLSLLRRLPRVEVAPHSWCGPFEMTLQLDHSPNILCTERTAENLLYPGPLDCDPTLVLNPLSYVHWVHKWMKNGIIPIVQHIRACSSARAHNPDDENHTWGEENVPYPSSPLTYKLDTLTTDVKVRFTVRITSKVPHIVLEALQPLHLVPALFVKKLAASNVKGPSPSSTAPKVPLTSVPSPFTPLPTQISLIEFMAKREQTPLLLDLVHSIRPLLPSYPALFFQPSIPFQDFTIPLPHAKGGWITDQKGGSGKRVGFCLYLLWLWTSAPGWPPKRTTRSTSLFHLPSNGSWTLILTSESTLPSWQYGLYTLLAQHAPHVSISVCEDDASLQTCLRSPIPTAALHHVMVVTHRLWFDPQFRSTLLAIQWTRLVMDLGSVNARSTMSNLLQITGIPTITIRWLLFSALPSVYTQQQSFMLDQFRWIGVPGGRGGEAPLLSAIYTNLFHHCEWSVPHLVSPIVSYIPCPQQEAPDVVLQIHEFMALKVGDKVPLVPPLPGGGTAPPIPPRANGDLTGGNAPPKRVREDEDAPPAKRSVNAHLFVASVPMENPEKAKWLQVRRHQLGQKLTLSELFAFWWEVYNGETPLSLGWVRNEIDRIKQQTESYHFTSSAESEVTSLLPLYPGKEWFTEDCYICLQPTRNRNPVILVCKHSLCAKCIQQWIHIKPNCPSCRCELLCPETQRLLLYRPPEPTWQEVYTQIQVASNNLSTRIQSKQMMLTQRWKTGHDELTLVLSVFPSIRQIQLTGRQWNETNWREALRLPCSASSGGIVFWSLSAQPILPRALLHRIQRLICLEPFLNEQICWSILQACFRCLPREPLHVDIYYYPHQLEEMLLPLVTKRTTLSVISFMQLTPLSPSLGKQLTSLPSRRDIIDTVLKYFQF